MDIAKVNKEYWESYETGTTPSVRETLSDDELSFLPPQASILDVGAGDGQLAEQLTNYGFKVSAIDVNANEMISSKQKDTRVDYSVQDITEGTSFEPNTFDLVIFCYVLANIHKKQWPSLRTEINRLLKPGGLVWLVEPLVSSSYEDRYKLASATLDDDHAFYVFHDPMLASTITNKKELQAAIDSRKISRIVRHYTEDELLSIFTKYQIIKSESLSHTSPSGFAMNAIKMVLKKP